MKTLTKALESAKEKLENELKKHRLLLSKKSLFERTTKDCNKQQALESALFHLKKATNELDLLNELQ